VVLADPPPIEQVSTSQVGNATKVRRPGEPLHVRFGVQPMDRFWEFPVGDTGIEIAPEYFDRIFVIFQRLHTRDEYEGTGIGPAVVMKIVARHGGRIGVRSTTGDGSTFFFTLLAARGAVVVEAPPAGARARRSRAPRTRTITKH
jgi:light-regulated signal transduction histidine kinase (bacteriophytochrome)